MIFVPANLGLAGTVADAAILQSRGKLNPAHHQRHARGIDRCCANGGQIDGVVLDTVGRGAAREYEAEKHETNARQRNWPSPAHRMLPFVQDHFRTPPGWRSSVLMPRIRIAGLALSVSVRTRRFSVDIRRFSSTSSMLSPF